MSISNAEIIEVFEQFDFDQRMQVADAIISRVLDFWPQYIDTDEVTQLESRAINLVCAKKFPNF